MNNYAPQMIVKTSSPWHVLATRISTAQTPSPVVMIVNTAEIDTIEIQISDDVESECPEDKLVVQWAQSAIQSDKNAGMTIRIVDSAEMQQSNLQWRGKDKPTNVLSFPAEFPPEAGVSYLGDILICAEVLERESVEQGKVLNDHWAHIVVHGVLHLEGFDHENDQEAQQMEQREKEILDTLGIADPYRYEY